MRTAVQIRPATRSAAENRATVDVAALNLVFAPIRSTHYCLLYGRDAQLSEEPWFRTQAGGSGEIVTAAVPTPQRPWAIPLHIDRCGALPGFTSSLTTTLDVEPERFLRINYGPNTCGTPGTRAQRSRSGVARSRIPRRFFSRLRGLYSRTIKQFNYQSVCGHVQMGAVGGVVLLFRQRATMSFPSPPAW